MFATPTGWSVQTMRAAQFDGIRGPVCVREMQVPEIDEADALVRVVTCGICRSDWHVWNGDWEWFGVKRLQPAVLGHEIGGVVEKVGSSVRHVQPGMRVTIPFHLACSYCPYCRRGEQNLCENRIVPHSTPGSGGWAQYMRAPNADLNCVPLPEGVDEMAAAALGCRYMTAWRAVQSKGGMRGGEIVAIFGCGGIGLAATEIASTLGARVIAVDQIRGSFGNPQSGYAELFRLVASRRLKPTALVSREVNLEDVDSVLRDMDTFKTLGYVIITRF